MSPPINSPKSTGSSPLGTDNCIKAHAKPRLAILGSRGIPAEFGGFETFAEQIAVSLVKCGWDVTVFCEANHSYRESEYKGVKLKFIKTPTITGLRSIWFDLKSIMLTLRGYDLVYMLGYHTAFAFFLPRLLGINFWVNMDGLEWKRSKWSSKVQCYLKTMEFLAARLASQIVADAQGIADYLDTAYPGTARKTHVLEYGAFPISDAPEAAYLGQYGLQPGEYYLIVCRLEPENHVLEIVQGFILSGSSRRLVVVGDFETGTPYARSLLEIADDRVSFLGAVFDQGILTALRFHCRTYFHGHSVGGTNPSLLESMACGNYVIAHDNVFNREVTAGLCNYFRDAPDLAQQIRQIDTQGPPGGAGDSLRARVVTYYNWDRVTNAYRQSFEHSLRTANQGHA